VSSTRTAMHSACSDNAELQGRTLGTAVTVLSGAVEFGTRVDVDVEWPVPLREAYRSWQPPEPSPNREAHARTAPLQLVSLVP